MAVSSYQFDKARLLSYTHTPISFENGTRYKIQKKLSVQGTLYVAYNNEGIKGTWTKAELLASAVDYADVVINGYSFGLGKITNVTFEPGNHVEKQDYTFEVECYSEVNSLSFGPGLTSQQAALIDKISETLSYEIDNDGSYVFSQSASVRMNLKANTKTNTELDTSPDPLTLAETVIDNLFADSDLFNSEIGVDQNLFFSGGLKILRTRSYSLVDSTCSFSRKLIIPPKHNSNPYSISTTYDLRYQDTGIVTITEKGTITGLQGGFNGDSATSGPYTSALSGYHAQFPTTSYDTDSPTDAYNRCNALYAQYGYPSAVPLILHPLQKSVTFDQFKGTVEYSVAFTNDPKYVGLATWVFTDKIEINENGDTIVSESGSFNGMGRPYGLGADNKLNNAKTTYNNNVGTGAINTPVYNRIKGLFHSYEVYKENTVPLFTMTKRSYEESQLDGTISYSFEYTDVSDYLNVVQDIHRVEVEKTTSMPVALTQTYNIFNYKQIIQPQNQATVGTRSVVVKLKGRRSLDLNTYLLRAKSIAADCAPTDVGATSAFIKTASYSWTPNTNDFTLNITWNFVGPNYTFGNTQFSYPS